jgi:glycolate oxidase FAD binding subunit
VSESLITPHSEAELAQVVALTSPLLAVGNRTKTPLSSASGANLVSLRSLSGILQYEPSEFTFTSRAGTTLAQIESTLQEKRQYLPFDPLLVDAGATIGGTVASGLSGPGRFRYGGLRDFLLGVRFLSGDGNVISAGGKVVKNAAGFDLPKFLIGSLGRYGVISEVTFKVFPAPMQTLTLSIRCRSHQQAIERMARAAVSRWEADALDYRPAERLILLRLAGPGPACAAIAAEIRSTWGDDVATLDDPAPLWRSVRELNWDAAAMFAVKVPITPGRFLSWCDSPPPGDMHLSAAANVVWILLRDRQQLAAIDAQLQTMHLAGLVVRGPCDQPCLGQWPASRMQQAVKAVMDPVAKFPPLVTGASSHSPSLAR